MRNKNKNVRKSKNEVSWYKVDMNRATIHLVIMSQVQG